NVIYGIIEDDFGNLWLSTQRGLAMGEIFPADAPVPENIQFTNYDMKDGLPGNEFNSGAFLRRIDGELIFGGVNGLLHFFPDSIRENRKPPAVVITGFKIFEKEITLDSAITVKKRIELSYQDNFFSLEFSALDFREPEKNRYAYRLEGFNDNWIYSGTRRYVTFSHLDPGKYIFRVRASNGANIWNKKGASLSIIILPPYWMTFWFRLLVGTIFLFGMVWVVRQIATRKLRRRLRELEVHQKLQNERDRISGELHDHIGANLTDLATGLEIAKKYLEKGELPDTVENLDFLEKHTRSTIEELRETIWSLNHKTSTIEEFCEKIMEYIHKRTMLSGSPEINLQENIEISQIFTPEQSLNLFRICQEAVNNALKHACAKKIEITIEVKHSTGLRISIKDNGTGFDILKTEEEEGGFGLINMKRRAQRIGAKLVVTSVNKCGTNIEIYFPG
ncbi:MAG: triple tyrosine motif-containing protein, partial [Calditrichia bacterium]